MNLALFDFDGTISNVDSMSFFFRSLYRNKFIFIYRHYIICLVPIIKYKIGMISPQHLKEIRINSHLISLSNQELSEALICFNNIFFSNCIRPKAIDRIKWHKSNGDAVCVVSASWDFLLSNWAKSNKIQLISNIIIKNENGSFGFQQPDCNYSEKINRIKSMFDLASFDSIYAYGDSTGDNEMLSIANYSYYKHF